MVHVRVKVIYVRSPEINMGVFMFPLGKVVVRHGAKDW